jgi:hypothetical protein
LYVAVAEERQVSQVRRGENSGRILTHVAVARALRLSGTVDLRERSATEVRIPLQPGWGGSGLRVVAFIEDVKPGRVIAVSEEKIKP